MTGPRDVALIVGSLRRGSLNLKLSRALPPLCPPELRLDSVSIGELPLYNEDLESDVPAAWAAFRTRIQRAQAVLFVTPEYNRSIPAPLKNAIDVGSRPYGKSVWSGKPAAIISVSPGAIGGFGANHHLRQCCVFLDMPVMQQPEAYVGHASKLFAEDGSLSNDQTREFLRSFLDSFVGWTQTHAA